MDQCLLMDKLITGLFALAGVFLGGYLAFLTQHQKLLLERKLEGFAKFLELIETAHSKASDILYLSALPEGADRELKMSEAYQPVFIQEKIIRLYLPQNLRDEFSKLVREYWANHATIEFGDSRFKTMRKKLDRIQEIFEQEVSPFFWRRPVSEWLTRLKAHLSRKM